METDTSASQMSPSEAWVRTQAYRLHRVMNAARRHLPKWLVALITVALLIPGPQDELLVALIIGVFAMAKPAMRADIGQAWRIYR